MVNTARNQAARIEALRAHVGAQRAQGERLRAALRSAKLSRALALELLREGRPGPLPLVPWLASITAMLASLFAAAATQARLSGFRSATSDGLVAVLIALAASLVASRPGAGGRARVRMRNAATLIAIVSGVILLTFAGRR
jgi:hypothetical protein